MTKAVSNLDLTAEPCKKMLLEHVKKSSSWLQNALGIGIDRNLFFCCYRAIKHKPECFGACIKPKI